MVHLKAIHLAASRPFVPCAPLGIGAATREERRRLLVRVASQRNVSAFHGIDSAEALLPVDFRPDGDLIGILRRSALPCSPATPPAPSACICLLCVAAISLVCFTNVLLSLFPRLPVPGGKLQASSHVCLRKRVTLPSPILLIRHHLGDSEFVVFKARQTGVLGAGPLREARPGPHQSL